jgi:uncharacterized protein with HEPN domain
MRHDDARDRVVEIMAALGKAREFVGSMSLADFAADDKTLYAVIRALEIAGEAAKRVPEAIRAASKTSKRCQEPFLDVSAAGQLE